MCYFRKNMHIIELLKGTNIMKIIKCYCPNCGAPTSIETDDMYRNYMFCTHCGSKILLDEDITSRIVDVGKLKEEENKKYIYDKEQEYKQQEKIKYDNLLDQRKQHYKKRFLLCSIITASCLLLHLLFTSFNIHNTTLGYILFFTGDISLLISLISIGYVNEASEKKLKNHK